MQARILDDDVCDDHVSSVIKLKTESVALGHSHGKKGPSTHDPGIQELPGDHKPDIGPTQAQEFDDWEVVMDHG